MGIVSTFPATERPYAAPTPIDASHRLDSFACGKAALDDWLKAHALENEGKASRTYIVTAESGPEAGNVVAYYTLATGGITRKEIPGKLRHGLPNPVPVLVLGRLAVDHRHARKGIGPAMLRETLSRIIEVSQTAGARALIVHAIDDEAVGFYSKYGFQIFPAGTRTMFLPIETILQAI